MATMIDFKREIKVGEGSIPHMYLDTVGKVTVGVGNMLPTVASAKKLPFINRITKKRATSEEIEADYNTVKKQPKGRLALSYKKHTKLDLPAREIEKLLDSRISEFMRDLRHRFPKFDSYPETAKMAILDMAFNLGVNGLVTKFPKMKKAIDKSDWITAAKECNRPQLSVTRNNLVKKWFNEAAKRKAKKEAQRRVEEAAEKK